jgi:hypothetical protein
MPAESVVLTEVYPLLKSLDPARLEKAQAIEMPAGGKISLKQTFIALVKEARNARSGQQFARAVGEASEPGEAQVFTGTSLIQSITINYDGAYATIIIRFLIPGSLLLVVPREDVETEDDDS